MPPDKPLWESYTRGVKPVSGKKKAIPPVTPRRKKAVQEEPLPVLLKDEGHPLPQTVLERKREKDLRKGALEIEARLDLHGLTQAQAFAALADFMRRNVRAGKRRLLVITGAGRDGEGVLRRNLKSWLSRLPEANSILAIREAAPRHGGKGAFYVLLKKRIDSRQ